MLTAELVWLNTEFDEVSRTCALLAGIAMLYATDAEDVRNKDAFRGIVELPFLHTTLHRTDIRLKLIDQTWYCYDGDAPHLNVYSVGVGLDGLVAGVLQLTTRLRPE